MQIIKRVLGSKIFLFLLLLAVIWVGLVSVRTFYKRYQLEQQIASLKTEINKLDKKDENLSQLIKYFNNQNFLEKEVKDRLNLKSPDENVVMVPEAAISQELAVDNIASTSVSRAEPQPAEKLTESNLIKWWNYFFGR